MPKPQMNREPTLSITQVLQADIIEFLSSKHTENATITLDEVMSLYKTPEDRARRVIANLEDDGVLARVEHDTWKVMI